MHWKLPFLHTKTSSAAGSFVPWPHTGDSASGPPLGAPPQTPIVGSRFRALHGCVFDPTFLYPPGPCMGPLPSSFVQSFPMPSSELRRITLKMWSCRCPYYSIIVQIKHSLIMQNCMHSTKRAKYSSPLMNSVTNDFHNFRHRCYIKFYTLLNFT